MGKCRRIGRAFSSLTGRAGGLLKNNNYMRYQIIIVLLIYIKQLRAFRSDLIENLPNLIITQVIFHQILISTYKSKLAYLSFQMMKI